VATCSSAAGGTGAGRVVDDGEGSLDMDQGKKS
jgi:hypothetical protein